MALGDYRYILDSRPTGASRPSAGGPNVKKKTCTAAALNQFGLHFTYNYFTRCGKSLQMSFVFNPNYNDVTTLNLAFVEVDTLPYTPFTQGLRPLCLPRATTKLSRSPLKAEGRQNGCLGRSRVVHRTFRHRHGRHGRREVLSMFKTVAQRSPRRSVAHRSLKGGRMKAHTSPWSQNGCTVVGHWSPS